ncbi:MAG: dethiobiotin synthase [Clostridiales bacterium]|nr:dethiobiotin synthase [Clostridiales bacterium]
MSKGLFITGTGTDIGKTYVTGLIVKRLHEAGVKAAYYKAAVSGNERDESGNLIPGDAAYVARISGIDQETDSMCPYLYERAYSPHLAARIEGNPVEMKRVEEGYRVLADQYDFITMEGSGGILCPIRYSGPGNPEYKSAQDVKDNFNPGKEIWLEDIIKTLDLPCLVVADAGLGTINAVVLTAEYMKAKKMRIKGIILNHFHAGNEMEEDNLVMCEARTGIPVVAVVGEDERELRIDARNLMNLYE